MSTTTIDTGPCSPTCNAWSSPSRPTCSNGPARCPRSTTGLRDGPPGDRRRRAHGAGVRGLARRLPRTGGGGLGAGLRLRALHGGQRPHRRDLPGRHGRPPPPGRGRARGLLPRPPARQRPRLPARRLPQGRLDPGGRATCSPRARRRSGPSAPRATAPRGCWRSGARSTPRSAASGVPCGSRGATRGSWATCTRTSPRRPARSTRCCRRPSSSRSSSSTTR